MYSRTRFYYIYIMVFDKTDFEYMKYYTVYKLTRPGQAISDKVISDQAISDKVISDQAISDKVISDWWITLLLQPYSVLIFVIFFSLFPFLF